MWWGRENNGNVVVVIYSFTIQEDVLKKVESGVDVGSIWGRCVVDVFVDEKYIYNKWGGENIKIVKEGIRKLRREKYQNCRGGNKKLRRENNKIVDEGIKKN